MGDIRVALQWILRVGFGGYGVNLSVRQKNLSSLSCSVTGLRDT